MPSRLHSYALVGAPLILALILLYLSFFATGSSRGTPENFLIGLAAIMFAILPTRQVIVPPEVQGLTRIDYILGFELLFLVFIGTLKFCNYVLQASSRPSDKPIL